MVEPPRTAVKQVHQAASPLTLLEHGRALNPSIRYLSTSTRPVHVRGVKLDDGDPGPDVVSGAIVVDEDIIIPDAALAAEPHLVANRHKRTGRVWTNGYCVTTLARPAVLVPHNKLRGCGIVDYLRAELNADLQIRIRRASR